MKWMKCFFSLLMFASATLPAHNISGNESIKSVNDKKITTKLLIKIPTRGRPEQFFTALDGYYSHLSNQVPYHFLITCDNDDKSMNNPEVIKKLSAYSNLTFNFSDNLSKVDAYNKDIDLIAFDILLAGSDNKNVQAYNYDKTIVALMESKFPDYDGVINYNDAKVGPQTISYPIVGKKYYQRFGYLYNPAYKSFNADEELTLVARVLGKEVVNTDHIITTNPVVAGQSAGDETSKKNAFNKGTDAVTFKNRRDLNFDIETKFANDPKFSKVWSIMICTLEERKEVFNKIYTNLMDQINALNLNDKVEVIFIRDNREITIGHKRNELMRMSKGKYVNFVDDDDEIHSLYVKIIYEKLLENPDNVDLMGIITTNGKNPKLFIHTIAYNNIYETVDGVYYRPPNHWNAMRKSIAAQFLFPKVNVGEDKAWTLDIARTGLLKKEAKIRDPYYFYNYDGKYG